MIKIIIVDDQKMLRDMISDTLNMEEDFEVVYNGGNASEIVELCEKYTPDLILMDVCTDNNENGIYYGGIVKEKYPKIKVIIMTGVLDINFVNDAKNVHIDSFIYKNIGKDSLIHNIRNTLDGYSVYPDTSITNEKNILAKLSSKELELLTIYCRELDRDEVCKKMNISTSTLKSHISSIYQKTGYNNLSKLAIFAVSNGFINPSLESK